MNLQKYFSPKRFMSCLQYDLYLNGKTYVLAFVVLFIILFIVDLFNLNAFIDRLDYQTKFPSHNPDFNVNLYYLKGYYEPIFTFFLVSGLIISAGTSFSALRSTTNSVSYLLLPASILEKYLVQFLIRVVAFTVLFFLLYWFTFKCTYLVYGFFEPVSETVKNYDVLFMFQKDSNRLYLKVLAITTCTLFAFAGATYFKKFAVFKSVFTFGLIAFFIFLLFVILSHIFYDHSSGELFSIKLQGYYVYENVRDKDLFFTVLFAGISLILLPLAYFNLKEREV